MDWIVFLIVVGVGMEYYVIIKMVYVFMDVMMV